LHRFFKISKTNKMSDPKVSIFTGRKTRYLAEKIAESYGAELGKSIVTNFSDGELQNFI